MPHLYRIPNSRRKVHVLGLNAYEGLPGAQKYVKNDGLYGYYYGFKAIILHTFRV